MNLVRHITTFRLDLLVKLLNECLGLAGAVSHTFIILLHHFHDLVMD